VLLNYCPNALTCMQVQRAKLKSECEAGKKIQLTATGPEVETYANYDEKQL
jgi:hypothetical protein